MQLNYSVCMSEHVVHHLQTHSEQESVTISIIGFSA